MCVLNFVAGGFRAMAHGHGAWLWPMTMAHGAVTQRAHMAAGSVAISGAISGFYWWKFEVYGWLFEAIFGAVFMYIRGLFSLIFRVVSRLHTSIFNSANPGVRFGDW